MPYSKLLVFLFFGITQILFAQDPITSIIKKATPVVSKEEFSKELLQKLNIPEDKFLGITSETLDVKLSFFVRPDGSVSKLRVVEDELGLTAYFTEVFEKLPLWNPAEDENGKKVSSRVTMVVKIYNNLYSSPYYKPAIPKGGYEDLNKKIRKGMNLNDKDWAVLRTHQLVQLTVVAYYEISEEGKVTGITLDNHISKLDYRFLKAFDTKENWYPATFKGVPVKSKVSYAYTLDLNWY